VCGAGLAELADQVGQPSGQQHRLPMQRDVGQAVEARHVLLGQRDDSRGDLSGSRGAAASSASGSSASGMSVTPAPRRRLP